MMRWPAIAVTACVTVSGVGLSAAANASPGVSGDGGQCTWIPLPPAIIDVSGTTTVTAGLKRGPCTLTGNPSGMTVCLSIQSETSAGECANTYGVDAPHVNYRYVPGATYVMTGRGCVNIYVAPYTLCQTFGPSNYIL